MNAHLLTLADLHAAAPGVLGVIFGRDGTFDDAPAWTAPIWWSDIRRWAYAGIGSRIEVTRERDIHGGLVQVDQRTAPAEFACLDCRVPAIAARLAALCAKASDGGYTLSDARVIHAGLTASRFGITEEEAGDVAGLTLSCAKAIAALKDAK